MATINFDSLTPAVDDVLYAQIPTNAVEVNSGQYYIPEYSGKFSREDVLSNDNFISRAFDNAMANTKPLGERYDLGKYGWQSVNAEDSEDMKLLKRKNNRNIIAKMYNDKRMGVKQKEQLLWQVGAYAKDGDLYWE